MAVFVSPPLNFGITAIDAQLFFICSTFKQFEFVCRGEKEFDVVAVRATTGGLRSLGIGRLLKLPAITLTTPAAVIHKAEKNKAGRSSQKAPFPSPTSNYFFLSPPGASASQTTES